jgi:hypothetical protein
MSAELDAGSAPNAAMSPSVHAIGDGAREQPQRRELAPVDGLPKFHFEALA